MEPQTLPGDQGLPALPVKLKTGEERFHHGGAAESFDLLQFWRWGCSELTSNVFRGVLAEFLIAKALDVAGSPRIEWATWDVKWCDVEIEVKSSSPYQTWGQRRSSALGFGMGQTTLWDQERGRYEGEKRRHAKVYVFSVLNRRGMKQDTDPLDLDQWEFFIVPTVLLEERHAERTGLKLEEIENGLGIPSTHWSGIRQRIVELFPNATP